MKKDKKGREGHLLLKRGRWRVKGRKNPRICRVKGGNERPFYLAKRKVGEKSLKYDSYLQTWVQTRDRKRN